MENPFARPSGRPPRGAIAVILLIGALLVPAPVLGAGEAQPQATVQNAAAAFSGFYKPKSGKNVLIDTTTIGHRVADAVLVPNACPTGTATIPDTVSTLWAVANPAPAGACTSVRRNGVTTWTRTWTTTWTRRFTYQALCSSTATVTIRSTLSNGGAATRSLAASYSASCLTGTSVWTTAITTSG